MIQQRIRTLFYDDLFVKDEKTDKERARERERERENETTIYSWASNELFPSTIFGISKYATKIVIYNIL